MVRFQVRNNIIMSWYPARSEKDADTIAECTTRTTTRANEAQKMALDTDQKHEKWANGTLKYTLCNRWAANIDKNVKESCRRHHIYGVVVKSLPPNHQLHGEEGLFTVKKFEKYDIIGEYTGKIVGPEVTCGHYLATLEDKADQESSLGLDAGETGNEMRFINSYMGIDFSPNVTMRTAYMNTYPHLFIVAMRDLDEGEELLLDYGAAYNNMYILPHVNKCEAKVTTEISMDELPGYQDDDGDDRISIDSV